MLYLKLLSVGDGRAYYNMLQHIGADENGFMNSVNGMEYDVFPAWLAKMDRERQGIGLADWKVPSSVFWLMDGDTPVGISKLRHRLTDALREHGGHIGYGVAAPCRGKGYGKALLGLTIQEARRMGITEDLLVTVNPENLPSRRVAEANGGELRQATPERCYYWFREYTLRQ